MHTRFPCRLPQYLSLLQTRWAIIVLLTGFTALHGCGGGGDGGNGRSGSDSGSGAESGSGDDPIQRSAVVNAPSQPPKFAEWERQMTESGQRWGNALRNEADFTTRLNLQYYDAQLVHAQIGHYLGQQQPWNDYADAAEDVYKEYLERADFRAAGYMRFPHGLYLDWLRNGDAESGDYLERLRDTPPFSDPSESAGEWEKQKYSREIAYSLQTQLVADRAGHAADRGRIKALADIALGHVEIWTTRNYLDTAPKWQFCQAFMAGLTASALIDYHAYTVESGKPDDRVLPALEGLAGFLWDEMWVENVDGSGFGAFEYVQPSTSGVGSETPAPDLNMLIAPLYAWLYLQTGNAVHLERGDDIFAGGVALSDLGGGKRFNQNYRTSFRFLGWRTEAVNRYQ